MREINRAVTMFMFRSSFGSKQQAEIEQNKATEKNEAISHDAWLLNSAVYTGEIVHSEASQRAVSGSVAC